MSAIAFSLSIPKIMRDQYINLAGLKKLPISFENGLITDIVEDFKNNYWVSSTKGLFLLTPEKEELNVASFYAGKAPQLN